MSRPLFLVSLLKLAFPRRFLAARATRLPVVGRLLDRWLFAGDDIIYLPRDRLVAVQKSVDLPSQTVLPSRVVEHFVEQAGFHWIMNFCICRSAEGCQDYPIELGCLFLGEAARGINPKLGRPVTKEEALAHVRRCSDAGLVHLIGRNKLDTVWLGIGPGRQLMTVCHCCPCCCLWRILPAVSPEIAAKVARMPGVMVQVNRDACTGCGACVRSICFVNAISMVEEHAHISEACRGCGRCVDVCPQGAIEITIADDQSVEKSVERLSTRVDVS